MTALALGVVLAAAGGAPARAATPIADPAGAAAGWIATQVEAGGLGAGSLAGSILAFAAAHVGGTAAADALVQLKAKADAYVGYGGTLNPDALGKVLLAVIVAGGDPTSFNGHNLEADLRGLLVTSGSDTGRFGTASAFGQALDILALAATPAGVPAGATDWLAGKQCASGDYQYDGSCPTAAGSEDPDTTAVAAEALMAAGSAGASAAGKAVAWLVGYQAKDGSFAAYGAANTTSTANAAEALRAAGKTAEADAAAAWIAPFQLGCSAPAGSRGEIPYVAGSTSFLIDSTAQGALAFGAPRLDKLTIAGATAAAPVLECAVTTPSPATSGAALPTEPPTDSIGGPAGTPSSGGLMLLAVLAASLGGALVIGRRPGQRH